MALKSEAWRLDAASYPLRSTLPTRYGDMDANAHLNNVAIARLIEEARVRFHWHAREKLPDGFHVRVMVGHVAIDYLREGHYPQDVEAALACVAIGTRSYRLAIGLFQKGEAFALSDSVLVSPQDPLDDSFKAFLATLKPRGLS
ncbi:acyl-CoA thioesterase [Sandaracinobacteroides sp. A072]|uniref:acyl-CoA thioesterase n=1 Tax=Sandaracinobacteroides sp. A072 TaxID=3461146 RepID=UPI00404326FA